MSRKYWEVAGLVAVWVSLSWIFHLNANQYLFLGIPLVVLFQLFIRRKPLAQLWVRDAHSFSLDGRTIVLALVLMSVPVYHLSRALPKRNWESIVWLGCCVVGAVFAAFAFGRLRREHITRPVVLSFLVAVGFHCTLHIALALFKKHSPLPTPDNMVLMLRDFYLYFLVCFTLEEVVFRGAVDSHVASNEDDTVKSWGSAVFVTALWGMWHLPTMEIKTAIAFVVLSITLILIHLVSGVALSFCWRAGGTLIFPALAHALVNAYRNAIW